MKSLREIQKKNLADARDAAFREADAAVGIPGFAAKIDWESPSFSVRRLREAVAASSFPQLLRTGVNQFMFDAYQQVDVTYPELVRVVNSDKAEELYAPLYGAELPKKVLPSQKFESSRLLGQDIRLRNGKWGRMLDIDRELIDDDQTGQVADRAQGMGQRIRLVEEAETYNALVAGAYTTAIGNAPALNVQVSLAALKAADVALENSVDPLGNFVVVQPDTVAVNPVDKFDVLTLLNSTLQPAVPGGSGQNASTASSGATGWTMSTNPLQGVYKPVSARYVPKIGLDGTHGAWFLMQAKKSLVFQDRDPLEVAQEAPNSGEGFERDIYRYRTRRRFAVGLIDSRFVYRGN